MINGIKSIFNDWIIVDGVGQLLEKKMKKFAIFFAIFFSNHKKHDQ